MDNFEKVEKLREKANVSYEEAKLALENSNWDMLDAMIYLEKNGKVFRSGSESYTTKREQEINSIPETEERDENDFSDTMKRFGHWCMKWIKKGNANDFVVTHRGKEIITVPITLLIVLLCFAFWVILPLLVIGLFFNMRYHFEGPDVHAVDLNQAMDDAANAAENMKQEFSGNSKENN